MVEYLTKQEVKDVLSDLEKRYVMEGKKEIGDAFHEAVKVIDKLYSVRPVVTATWKTIGDRKETIYCGRCGFQTMAYKRTMYCPECGRKMLNGRRMHDQG